MKELAEVGTVNCEKGMRKKRVAQTGKLRAVCRRFALGKRLLETLAEGQSRITFG